MEELERTGHSSEAILLEIARLYYSENLSQAAIAQRFQVSRSLISKLLSQARERKLVTIDLVQDPDKSLSYEYRLKSRYHLKQVCVVNSRQEKAVEQAIGKAAARLLSSELADGMRIGIEWGTSLYQMIKHFEPSSLYRSCEVVQLHGMIDSEDPMIEGSALVRMLSEKLFCDLSLLQAPMVMTDRELKLKFVKENKIASALEAARRCDIACVGIGTNAEGDNILSSRGYIRKEESRQLKEAGATAMISGWFLDAKGQVVDLPVSERIIGLHPQELKEIPVVMAVAWGHQKAQAIRTVLEAGYLDILVTDSATAELVLTEAETRARIDRETALDIYERMLLTSECEMRIERLFTSKRLHGTTHLCLGQEASSTVSAMALEGEDLLFGTHRGHGQALGKGLDPFALFAELYGSDRGCSRGLGGSMHLYDNDAGILGTNGIVAGAVPIAAGAALACRYSGAKRIAAVYLGDGAVNEGAFHEAVNMASLWKLPLLLLLENNQYGFSTRPEAVIAGSDLQHRVESYGIGVRSIDGNDPFEVYEQTQLARKRVLEDGPYCLILETYRRSGHSKSDKNAYRSQEEIRLWEARSPLEAARRLLRENYGLSEKELSTLSETITARVENDLAKAAETEQQLCSIETHHVYAPSRVEGSEPLPSTDRSRTLTYRLAVREAVRQAMEKDRSVILLGEDIGVYGGSFHVLEGLFPSFGPERMIETPIAEEGFTGIALGAALCGLRPVVEFMFSDFLAVAMDQIVNQAAKYRFMFGGTAQVPMVIRTPSGCGTGAAAQHSQSLEAWFMHIPGLKVLAPSNAYDAKGLLLSAIEDPNPVIFLESKSLYETSDTVPEEPYSIPIGKAHIVNEGSGVTLISYGRFAHTAREIILRDERLTSLVEMIDLRSLSPLDTETIRQSVNKTGAVLIVHEAVTTGGPGAEILSCILEDEKVFSSLRHPPIRLGARFTPVPFSRELEAEHVPDETRILEALQRLLS